MNIDKLENKLKELSEELENIKEKRKKTITRWRAQKNEEYFYIDSEGDISYTDDCRFEEDDFRYLTGNYFKTEEKAEKAKEKLLSYMQLKDTGFSTKILKEIGEESLKLLFGVDE